MTAVRRRAPRTAVAGRRWRHTAGGLPRRAVRIRLRRRTLLHSRFRLLRWLRERRRLRSVPVVPLRNQLSRVAPDPRSGRRLPVLLRIVRLRKIRPPRRKSASRRGDDEHRFWSADAPCPYGGAGPRRRRRSARRDCCGWRSACRPRCAPAPLLRGREPARAKALLQSQPPQPRLPQAYGRELRWPRSRLGLLRSGVERCWLWGAEGGRRHIPCIGARWRRAGARAGDLGRRTERWNERRAAISPAVAGRPKFRGAGG